ncbi:hypothetical protein D9M68_594630 [compost metagenome]
MLDRGHAGDRIAGHVVVGQDVGEHRRVEGGSGRVDFTDDAQLAGRDFPGKQEGYELHQAVDGGDHRLPRLRHMAGHRDANVEEALAVQQVIATTSLEDVAAATTEDDVAGRERGHHG